MRNISALIFIEMYSLDKFFTRYIYKKKLHYVVVLFLNSSRTGFSSSNYNFQVGKREILLIKYKPTCIKSCSFRRYVTLFIVV